MLTTAATTASAPLQLGLVGQTIVVIGAGGGVGLETARRARNEGADVIVTGRDPARLERAALEVGARGTAAFDANDPVALKRFFDDLPGSVDHVVVTAGDRMLALDAARNAAKKIRPFGTLVFIGGIGPEFTAALAVALAPVRVRVNLVDPGPVDAPLPASLLDDLVTERIAGANDVAALAVHVMADTALNGATYDIDGDLQLLPQGV